MATTQLDKDLMVGTRSPKATMPPRHRFLEPIHNVKERGEPLMSAPANRHEDLVFISGNEKMLVEPAGIEPATSSLQS